MDGWNPQWFTLEALTAEWRRKDIRKWLIGMATLSIVLALCSQPETMHVAVYIDSVGIDVALSLLEVQLLVALALCWHQAAAIVRAEYARDGVVGVSMRKVTSMGRYLREAMRGSFR